MNLKLKIVFFILLIFSPSITLFAQKTEKISIAVLDFKTLNVNTSAQTALSERLQSELSNIGHFTVVERNEIVNRFREQDFEQSGCSSDECIVEAGRLLAVDRMIAGSLGKIGSIFSISLRMIDIESGCIIFEITEDCNCPIEVVVTTFLRKVVLKTVGLSHENVVEPDISDVQVAGRGTFEFKSNPAGARVYIDDELMKGVTPLSKEGIAAGIHQIGMEKNRYYSSNQTVFLKSNELKQVELTLKKLDDLEIDSETNSISPNEKRNQTVRIKSNRKALVLSLSVPGLGQFYLAKKGKAALFSLLEIGAITSAFVFNSQYNDSVDLFNFSKPKS